MGRFRDAFAVMLGRRELADDSRYILRSEVPTLHAQLAELELSVATTLEKLNTMAARLRKREQRAVSEAAGSSNDGPDHPELAPNDPSESKRALRARYARERLGVR